MQVAAFPITENERLKALEATNLLDTPPDPAFDRITRLASTMFDMPIALVSLVDRERQWFKARVGLEVEETSRDVAFCAHAVLGTDVLVVPDAADDSRFSDNPLVTSQPGIRFYAGAPLTTEEGYNLGTLCVLDREPRVFSARQVKVLQDLAGMVVNEIELRRLASSDALTGLMNRRHVLELAEREVKRARRTKQALTVVLLDIDRFKSINDRFGHPAGDSVLRAFAKRVESAIRDYDLFGRLGGEEFLAVLPHTTADQANALLDRVRDGIAGCRVDLAQGQVGFTVSIGVSEVKAEDMALNRAIARADSALYEAKESGRNRVICR